MPVKILLLFFLLFPFLVFSQNNNKASLNRSYPQFPDSVDFFIAQDKYSLAKKDIEKWLSEETRLVYNASYRSEIENIDFCEYKKSLACLLSFSKKDKNHIQKFSIIFFDENSIKKYLHDLARSANQDPENAKLKIEGGKAVAFSQEKSGLKLNEEKSLEIILNHLKNNPGQNSVNLVYDEIKPDISLNSINDLGITTLIAEGRSNFRGSPQNRIFNIKVALNRFDGITIKPGEEFSFVKILGEVDGEHGYLPELVIKKNKTEPEFGGGICQVSTTMFRAAINAGLEITARRNHAYPVSYYNPQGMDATVYVPRPDLRFINNTPGHILVQPIINGTELVFQFYGTDDGRKVNITGPTITERNPDGSMKTTFTEEVLDKNGNVIINDIFNSVYDSPNKYPHPATTTEQLKSKPNGWSDKEWKAYKKSMGI